MGIIRTSTMGIPHQPVQYQFTSYRSYELRHIPYVLPYMDDLLPYIKRFTRYTEAGRQQSQELNAV